MAFEHFSSGTHRARGRLAAAWGRLKRAGGNTFRVGREFTRSLWIALRTGDGTWRSRFLRLLLLVSLLMIPLGLLLAIGLGVYEVKASKFDLSDVERMNERSWILDRYGEQMGHVSGHGENRQTVTLEDVSPHFVQALLAREDSRFYRHGGVDWIGVARAAVRNAKEGEVVQGASTLTMQLVRNTWGIRDRTLKRKLLEAALARRLERASSKEEILEAYMNRIYFGSGLYGIERAAQGFFMKPASELTLGESALLAGIIRAPTAMSPFRDVELAYEQRDQVLDRLVKLRKVKPEVAEAEKKQRIFLRPQDQRMAELDYVLQSVHDEVNRFLPQILVEQGGLRIYSTIDPALQAEATRILDEKLTEIESQKGFPHPARAADETRERTALTNYVQGAVVIIENETGDILAMVGGRNFGDSPFNRAMHARRQIGSTFKPFIFAEAFDRGIKPGVLVSDGPLALPNGNGSEWRPQNSDGKFGGYYPAAVGLIRSRNTMSIRIGNSIGLDNVLSLAARTNLLHSPPPQSPVAFLGSFDSTPLSVAGAYSTFPNRGIYRRPRLIRSVESLDGTPWYAESSLETRVLSEEAAWTTSEVLREVVRSGTAASAKELGLEELPAHGKTGTTNDYKDAWFAGYTDKVTCVVWVGMDRPETIMSRGYGSTLALPIWVDVVKAAETTCFAAEPLTPPEGYQKTPLCKQCGMLASSSTSQALEFTLPLSMIPPNACVGRHDRLNDQSTASRSSRSARPQPVKKVGKTIRKIGRRLFGR